MALIAKALCTLADVKAVLNIPTIDTTKDALLEKYINASSVAVSRFCNRDFQLGEKTENLTAHGEQYLPLAKWPITEIDTLTVDGSEYEIDVDYYMSAEDAERGFLYKPEGWKPLLLRGGLTEDPIGVQRNIEVIYTAGYLLPGDEGYTEGEDTSLPVDISFVCAQIAADKYTTAASGGLGVKSIGQGGLSYTFFDGTTVKNSFGIKDEHAAVLYTYMRAAVA